MAFAKVYTAQINALVAHAVSVETDLSRGLYSFTIVGLPDKAVEEARDRVSAAIKNSGFRSPKSKNEKVVISLAPADLKKEGPLFDLSIALSYLLASGDINFDPKEKLFAGELSLDGTIRPIKGALPIAKLAKDKGFREVYVPDLNADEAALVSGIDVYGVKTLRELLEHLREGVQHRKLVPRSETELPKSDKSALFDLSDIRGQESSKRALEIAAAGFHNVAFYGPPGVGKTMLAKSMPSLLPELEKDEVLEVTSIHSVSGMLSGNVITTPPFRAPHHTSSYVSIVGGGTIPKPGEVTLAHRGVLFLDEFPEFDKRVIEALREPLEDRIVRVARARNSVVFPAHFLLIAAMNPCPCGNFGGKKSCVCTPNDLIRYRKKISGPVVDRIDIWTEVGNIDYEKLSSEARRGSDSKAVRSRIIEARSRQRDRMQEFNFKTNSDIGVKYLEKLAPLKKEVRLILNESAEKLKLSPRAYHKTIKVARTIADLDGKETIEKNHILEALQYRPKIEMF